MTEWERRYSYMELQDRHTNRGDPAVQLFKLAVGVWIVIGIVAAIIKIVHWFI